MNWRLDRKTRSRLGRSAIALVLAVNHVVIALGIPIPMPLPSSPASPNEMFPCMNCPCGCRTAERCWRHCCCYTMPQKLAWARAHGVTPPAFVVEAAAREAAVSGESHADDHKPCCPHCHKKALRAETTAAHGDSHSGKRRGVAQGAGVPGLRPSWAACRVASLDSAAGQILASRTPILRLRLASRVASCLLLPRRARSTSARLIFLG